MFFLYGKKEPGYSWCRLEYIFEEYETLEDAEAEAVCYENEGYTTTLIEGEKITLSNEMIAAAKARKAEKQAQDKKQREIVCKKSGKPFQNGNKKAMVASLTELKGINMETFFKVTFRGYSWGAMIRETNLALTYSLDEKTIPLIGKIFVFKTKKDVIAFLGEKLSYKTDNAIIFEGTGTNPKAMKIAARYVDFVSFVRTFWTYVVSIDYDTTTTFIKTFPTPEGTIVVDDFTPTKRYTYNELISEGAE